MDLETLDLLEFDRVLEILGKLAQSPMGRAAIQQIRPSDQSSRIQTQLAQVEEAADFVSQQGRIRCDHLIDPEPILTSLELPGGVLTSPELLSVLQFLDFGSDVTKTLTVEEWPQLSVLTDGISIPSQLVRELRRSIDDKGEIREGAYPDLANARRQRVKGRARVQQHLGGYLTGPKAKWLISEPYITQRADRYVIPVRVEHQKDIQGIVHGTSSSGATVFLEPLSCVQLNNQWIYHQEREKEILSQILVALTQLVRSQVELLRLLSQRAGWIDAVFASAEFSKRYRCIPAEVTPERGLKITQARHPLLIQTLGDGGVVPISVELSSERNGLVISGPNTGGKTVALKTIGLLMAMTHAGLPIPAAEAKLPLVKDILADVGDHQSITQQLSTFSSHIGRINQLLKNQRYPCLVLLDEIGRGTDPTYGAALAVAIIEHFRQLESLVVATTHHQAVKQYAASRTGVRNASVSLDSDSMRPTFVLEFGVAGSSSGIEIAGQLGMPDEILNHARSLLDSDQLQVEGYLAELRSEVTSQKEKNYQITLRLDELNRTREQLEGNAAERERERERAFEKALEKWGLEFRTEAKRYLRKLADRFAAARAREESKSREISLKEAFRLKLREEKDSTHSQEKDREPFSVGDTVYHSLFKNRGVVVSVDADQVRLEMDGKTVSASPDQLSKLTFGEAVKKPSRHVTLHVVENTEPELNLIGMSVDDAIAQLDKFLDRAFVSELREVTIIHGFGTGRLKSAVSDFLSTHIHVDKVQVEGGATIAKLLQ